MESGAEADPGHLEIIREFFRHRHRLSSIEEVVTLWRVRSEDVVGIFHDELGRPDTEGAATRSADFLTMWFPRWGTRALSVDLPQFVLDQFRRETEGHSQCNDRPPRNRSFLRR